MSKKTELQLSDEQFEKIAKYIKLKIETLALAFDEDNEDRIPTLEEMKYIANEFLNYYFESKKKMPDYVIVNNRIYGEIEVDKRVVRIEKELWHVPSSIIKRINEDLVILYDELINCDDKNDLINLKLKTKEEEKNEYSKSI